MAFLYNTREPVCYVFSVVAKLISTGTGKKQDRSLLTRDIMFFFVTWKNRLLALALNMMLRKCSLVLQFSDRCSSIFDAACDSSCPTGCCRARQTIRWDCQLKNTHGKVNLMSVHQFAYKRKNNIQNRTLESTWTRISVMNRFKKQPP